MGSDMNDASSTDSPNMTPAPPFDVAQEVRFAVVMYGGVSLAIYINGVAQELLRFVRATAPLNRGGSAARPLPVGGGNIPADTELVYRKLSYLLSDQSLLTRYREQLKNAADEDHPAAGKDTVDDEIRKCAPIRTRFIIDILSGTSAGGINGIYLAKALANDQSIDALKKLWVDEGDIALLLNDKESVARLKLKNQKPPLSLLNSRRMYLKLLTAFDGMDGGDRARSMKSPYLDELDLFITTTDLEGVPLPLRLSDKIVYERRHRNVFHFKYATMEAAGGDRNDFSAGHNPFLAFAARCTSSFPFAFEPMRLCDIDEVLDLFPHYRNDSNCRSDSAKWQPYFTESINPDTGVPNLRFAKRSFGDGGYLDNKPFSYATETLTRRHANVPVDRKLIYIEPSPEHAEDDPERNEKPDFLKNVKAALTDLPTYETIREDLQRVLDRNRLISRVNRLTVNIEKDIARYDAGSGSGDAPARPKVNEGEWDDLDLAQMIKKYGVYYLPYRRLRIADVTDGITDLVAYIGNFDAESDQFTALRCLITAWRERTYTDYHTDGKQTVNNYLNDYDFSYRLRRLNYVLSKIDQLYILESLPAAVPAPREAESDSPETERVSPRPRLNNEQEVLIRKLAASGIDYLALTIDERAEFVRLLRLFKCDLNESFKQLRVGGRKIRKAGKAGETTDGEPTVPDSPERKPTFAEKVAALGITGEHLKYLLGMEWASVQANTPDAREQTARAEPDEPAAENLYTKLEEACKARVEKLFQEPGRFNLPADVEERLKDAASTLKNELDAVLRPTSARCKELLNPENNFPGFSDKCRKLFGEPADDPAQLLALRTYLWGYFSHFDDYDQISFPVFYETGVAEADVVEVIRISPEDATSLINEREEQRRSADGRGRQKLAGVALHHFGAFLDRVWRQNDIMWGRLDGAERIISALLPEPRDEAIRKRLIREAQTAIFVQELTPESRRELGTLMSNALVRASADEGVSTAVERVIKDLRESSPIQTRLEAVIRSSLADRELIKLMTDGYEVNRQLDPKPMLRVMSRSTQIVGEMFEEVANSYRLEGNHLRWIARLGQMFWGLVEVAVPNSILNQLFFHWLKLLYVFELVLLFGAILLGSEEVRRFALTLFGVTAGVNITVLLLRDMMRLRRGWLRLFITLFVGFILLLAVVGADELFDLGIRAGLAKRVQSILNVLGNIFS